MNIITSTHAGVEKKAEVVFVVDVSRSMTRIEIEQVKRLLSAMVSLVSLSTTQIQIGILLTGVLPGTLTQNRVLYLTDGADKQQVMDFISRIQMGEWKRDFSAALQFVEYNMFTSAKGSRSDASRAIIMLGKNPLSKEESMFTLAERLKKDGVILSYIGIGDNININNLRRVISDRTVSLSVLDGQYLPQAVSMIERIIRLMVDVTDSGSSKDNILLLFFVKSLVSMRLDRDQIYQFPFWGNYLLHWSIVNCMIFKGYVGF